MDNYADGVRSMSKNTNDRGLLDCTTVSAGKIPFCKKTSHEVENQS